MDNLTSTQQDTLFQQIVEMAPAAMIVVERNGLIEILNAQAEKIFGYTRTELQGQSIDTLLPLRIQAQHPLHREFYFKHPAPRAMGVGRDLFAQRKDGSEFPVEIGLNPISTPSGIKVLAAIVDISERKRTETVLRESEERFRMMVESVKDYALIMLDSEGYIVGWNIGAERLKGYPSNEVIGKHFSLFYNHEDNALNKPTQELKMATVDGHFEDEGWRVRKDGSQFLANVVITPVHDQYGKLRGFAKVTRDITKSKEIELRNLQLIDELQGINEELNNFTRIASHDLKAPLRNIESLADWIAEDLGDQLTGETQQYLNQMHNRIKRMESLLDDLLAYARVGRTANEIVRIDTGILVRDIFELMSNTQHITLELDKDMPIIQARKVPLELVFRNLISNAIKHHNKPQGKIIISVHTGTDAVEFSVKDDGPGIAPQHQARVFDIFQRINTRNKTEGNGLGLAMVKKAVESEGGKIMLDSDGINGCNFRFTWLIRE